MTLIKDEWLLPLGAICLVIALLADRFLLIEVPIIDFVVGIFAGLALVLNLFGLVKMSKKMSS
ncbi:hypothetical protein E4H12_00730 [Candidatus Thorarchaeota archaeon]|nr:MAG: hypothetical protein E4H12_00730 [Candidatus Thorarchaeota archaeon]